MELQWVRCISVPHIRLPGGKARVRARHNASSSCGNPSLYLDVCGMCMVPARWLPRLHVSARQFE